MFEYILSDFKRAIKSKQAKIYFFATLALILVANIAVICFRFIYGSNEGTFAYNVFEYASWCFLIPYYSCIYIAIISFGKEYIQPQKGGMVLPLPGDTEEGRKGKVVLRPWQLYVAKLVTAVLLAAVFLVAAGVLLYVLTYLFHANEGIIEWMIVRNFLNKACISLSLWFAGISFAMMFLFMFEKKWKAIAGFAVIVGLIPQLIRIFSLDTFKFEFFRMIRRYTITQSFGLVPYPSYPERSVPLIVTLGLVYAAIAIATGIAVYNRKAS